MSLATMIYGQFGRPRGLLGALAGTIMARRPSNRARSEWAVSLLAIEPTDQVLEIGSGPGIALALASEGAPLGRVVGIDHSDLMCRWARERNAEAVRAGRVEVRCAGLEALDDFPATFDKAFSVNVAQFCGGPRWRAEAPRQRPEARRPPRDRSPAAPRGRDDGGRPCFRRALHARETPRRVHRHRRAATSAEAGRSGGDPRPRRGAVKVSALFRRAARSAAMRAAYSPPLNTAEPATRTLAPALDTSGAVSGVTPPSISMSIAGRRSSP